MKTCPDCNVAKPLTLEHWLRNSHNPQKFQLRCRECRNKIERERHAADPSKSRRHKLFHNFRIRQADYDLLLIKQKAKCAICGSAFTKSPHVDHDHATKKVRGLLCGTCNRMLGLAYDSRAILMGAFVYLEKHS